MTVVVRPVEDPPGLRLVDEIENTRFTFETPRPVSPSPAPTDRFHFPVDRATTVETAALVVPKLLDVYVRDAADGGMVAESSNRSGAAVDHGEYDLELVASEMKLYVHVESAVAVERGQASVTLDFGEETAVTVGARSFHERPAHTVTVPDRVTAAMEAVSTFGSALKTTTPERSYPTLRGHPPLLERGDELAIPDGVERPETGVRVEVPATWDRLYPVVSLSYYLGAEVVPGEEPRLVTDRGFTYDLDGPGGFEATVARTLKQVFFLDCITRTEGYYQLNLHERALTEPEVDLDFAALYDRPLAEQVEAYLGESYEALEPAMPAWKRTVDVRPAPDQLPALPYAAADLAVVRCPDLPESADPSPVPGSMVEFYRSADRDDGPPDGPIVSPEPTDSLEHVWFGEGYPAGATKGSVDAYRRQLRAEPRDDLGIEVAVVCNDPRMAEEGETIADLYGASDRLAFEVTYHHDLTTDALRAVLETEMDFLHFVGHVEPSGIECVDGPLDVATLSRVGPTAFVLNGCRSYVQAERLVEGGSLGGVATLSRVGNRAAREIGRVVARLLNQGYPLYASLDVATAGHPTTGRYLVVGDSAVQLVDVDGLANVLEIEERGDGYAVEIFDYVPDRPGLGSHVTIHAGDDDRYYLAARAREVELSEAELLEYLGRSTMPIRTDDGVTWGEEYASRLRDD